MQKNVWIAVGVGIGLAAFFSLLASPVSFIDIFKQPLQSLLGTQRNLETSVLEVSEHMDPISSATRRLFKPLGSVHLTRRFPGTPMPPHQPNEDPASNQSTKR